MADITLMDAINQTQQEFDEAQARVSSLESRLSTLRSILDELQPKTTIETPIAVIDVSDDDHKENIESVTENLDFMGTGSVHVIPKVNSLGLTKAIIDAIETADRPFSARTIAEGLAGDFPDIPVRKIARRASQYVMTYYKKGKLNLVKRGGGKVPNLYELRK